MGLFSRKEKVEEVEPETIDFDDLWMLFDKLYSCSDNKTCQDTDSYRTCGTVSEITGKRYAPVICLRCKKSPFAEFLENDSYSSYKYKVTDVNNAWKTLDVMYPCSNRVMNGSETICKIVSDKVGNQRAHLEWCVRCNKCKTDRKEGEW